MTVIPRRGRRLSKDTNKIMKNREEYFPPSQLDCTLSNLYDKLPEWIQKYGANAGITIDWSDSSMYIHYATEETDEEYQVRMGLLAEMNAEILKNKIQQDAAEKELYLKLKEKYG